jgi:hypothetical protein
MRDKTSTGSPDNGRLTVMTERRAEMGSPHYQVGVCKNMGFNYLNRWKCIVDGNHSIHNSPYHLMSYVFQLYRLDQCMDYGEIESSDAIKLGNNYYYVREDLNRPRGYATLDLRITRRDSTYNFTFLHRRSHARPNGEKLISPCFI